MTDEEKELHIAGLKAALIAMGETWRELIDERLRNFERSINARDQSFKAGLKNDIDLSNKAMAAAFEQQAITLNKKIEVHKIEIDTLLAYRLDVFRVNHWMAEQMIFGR